MNDRQHRGPGWRRRAGALAAILALTLPACGRVSDTGGDTGDGPPVVGLAGSFLTDPFQVVLIDSIEAQAEEAGIDLLPPTDAEADPGKQVADMTTLLSQDIGGLITIPVDSDAVVPGIERANEQDVPVVTVDVAPNGGDVAMVVRANNVEMGASACEQLGEAIGGQGTVLELQGNLASVNGSDRSDGFNECMRENYPSVEIISRPTDWDTAKATDIAQTVLSTTDVQGVFMASDSVMASGVADVLQRLNKWHKVGEPGHVALVSIDGTSAGLDLIREGYQDALVSQPVDLYAQYAVRYILDAIDGTEHAEGPTDHGSEIATIQGGNLEDRLPSPVVTADNADDPELWGNNQTG